MVGKVLRFLGEEIKEALPAMVFFFITFQLVLVTKTVVLTNYQITATGMTVAFLGAAIVGKAVLIASKLPFIEIFEKSPAVLAVLWKTFFYSLMTLLFRYAEELIPLISKYGGFAGANAHLFEEISWPHFWIVQMWLIAAMVAFCSIGEIIDAFGADKVKRLFFARRLD